jgi:hypothetical protein
MSWGIPITRHEEATIAANELREIFTATSRIDVTAAVTKKSKLLKVCFTEYEKAVIKMRKLMPVVVNGFTEKDDRAQLKELTATVAKCESTLVKLKSRHQVSLEKRRAKNAQSITQPPVSTVEITDQNVRAGTLAEFMDNNPLPQDAFSLDTMIQDPQLPIVTLEPPQDDTELEIVDAEEIPIKPFDESMREYNMTQRASKCKKLATTVLIVTLVIVMLALLFALIVKR